MRHPVLIGGPGHTVEIDESLLVRRKYNVGHQVGEQWVFGGRQSRLHGSSRPSRRRYSSTDYSAAYRARNYSCF